MPWTVADVDSHKKGLTPAQKKEWVKIANDTLASCEKSGGSDCEGKAIRVANSKFADDAVVLNNVPPTAFVLSADECFAKVDADADPGRPARMQMTAYSGKIIKNHWWWGDLAIDTQGMSFPKRTYPILEGHDPSKKIAFMKKPKVMDDFSLVVEPDLVTFVETDASKEFIRLSKEGFPYEASIHAVPDQIQRLSPNEVAEVNGFSMKGPGTIWRKSTFKEASVCLFGYDSQTSSVALEKPLAMSVNSSTGQVNFGTTGGTDAADHFSFQPVDTTTWVNYVFTYPHGGETNMPMTIEQFKNDSPEEYGKLVAQIAQQAKDEALAAFAKEKADLETKFTDEVKGLRESIEASEKRILQFEKTEEIRREGERRSQADTLFRDALAASNIPEYLFSKVMKQIDYTKFVVDGALDTAKFSEAIAAEIKDWEDSGAFVAQPQPRVQGGGTTLRVVIPPDRAAELAKEDDAAVEEMLEYVGQGSKK